MSEPCVLSLDTLAKWDWGKPGVAWQHALRQAVEDCSDRPAEKKPRKVVMVAELVPHDPEPDGDVVDCDLRFFVDVKIPSRKTSARPAMLRHDGSLIFNAEAPDNPRQQSLNFEDDNQEETK